jgi:hypothetical protein
MLFLSLFPVVTTEHHKLGTYKEMSLISYHSGGWEVQDHRAASGKGLLDIFSHGRRQCMTRNTVSEKDQRGQNLLSKHTSFLIINSFLQEQHKCIHEVRALMTSIS